MNTQKIRNAWAAAKKSAGRELGLFVFMMVFGVIVALVALPIIYIMNLLPDWTWWIWSAAFLVWLIFGDTIANSVRAYRGEKP